MSELTICTASWTAVYRHSKEIGAGNEGFMPVRTSVGIPRFWPAARGFPIAKLLTPYGLRKLTGHAFRERYIARLTETGVEKIRTELNEIAAGFCDKPLALLCFEKEPGECHRGQFAEWWETMTGERITELDPQVIGLAGGAETIPAGALPTIFREPGR